MSFDSGTFTVKIILSGTCNTVFLVYALKWTINLLVCFRRVKSELEVQLFVFVAVLTSNFGSIILRMNL